VDPRNRFAHWGSVQSSGVRGSSSAPGVTRTLLQIERLVPSQRRNGGPRLPPAHPYPGRSGRIGEALDSMEPMAGLEPATC